MTDPLEPLARAICRNLGLDPDQKVRMSSMSHLTEAEADQLDDAWSGSDDPMKPRWMRYRSDADHALAVQKAIAEVGRDGE